MDLNPITIEGTPPTPEDLGKLRKRVATALQVTEYREDMFKVICYGIELFVILSLFYFWQVFALTASDIFLVAAAAVAAAASTVAIDGSVGR